MNPLIQFRTTTLPLFIPLVFVCFALAPAARAVSPAPDGGYPGGNTAEGADALLNLDVTLGIQNTGIGRQALLSNVSGDNNTATGFQALRSNTDGLSNTATGFKALFSNEGGDGNTAVGATALFDNTTGGLNTAVGDFAVPHSVSGSQNTGVGFGACSNVTTAGGVVCIGTPGANVDDTTYIRNVYSSAASNRIVYVNSNNRIGTLASTRRVKDDIKPMDKASETILALNPVTFRFKQEIDPARAPQFGLVAEEVAEVSPDLVTRDAQGRPETVRYDSINAMMLNEFLKEHRTVEELKKEITVLTATVKEQAVQIQKVSAQIGVTKAAPQTVANNQ